MKDLPNYNGNKLIWRAVEIKSNVVFHYLSVYRKLVYHRLHQLFLLFLWEKFEASRDFGGNVHVKSLVADSPKETTHQNALKDSHAKECYCDLWVPVSEFHAPFKNEPELFQPRNFALLCDGCKSIVIGILHFEEALLLLDIYLVLLMARNS